jgi:hypothetical protein
MNQSLESEANAFRWVVIASLIAIPTIGLLLARAQDPITLVPSLALFVLLTSALFVFGIRTPRGVLGVGLLLILVLGGSGFALVVRPSDQDLAGLWMDFGHWAALVLAGLGAIVDTLFRKLRARSA